MQCFSWCSPGNYFSCYLQISLPFAQQGLEYIHLQLPFNLFQRSILFCHINKCQIPFMHSIYLEELKCGCVFFPCIQNFHEIIYQAIIFFTFLVFIVVLPQQLDWLCSPPNTSNHVTFLVSTFLVNIYDCQSRWGISFILVNELE